MHKKNVAIGLCTYRRPRQLVRCLQSLAEMAVPDAFSLCVIIVDNDPEGTAQETVNTFKEVASFPVYYRVEPRKGIPCARNSVLKQAAMLGITDLAFVDDDEYVEPTWLEILWSRYAGSDADVMAGYVTTVYPPETPRWITKGRFFQNPRRQSDTQLLSAATGNVIFDFQKLALQWGLSFDEGFALTGGSDADFFYRAAYKGAVIKWTGDAVVYEELAQERMRIGYLLKNRFRKSNLKLGYKKLSLLRKIKLFFGLLKRIIVDVFLLPFSLLRGLSDFFIVLNRTVGTVANILALMGCRIKWNEYKDPSA